MSRVRPGRKLPWLSNIGQDVCGDWEKAEKLKRLALAEASGSVENCVLEASCMFCTSVVKGGRETELLRGRQRMPEDIWGLRDDITGPLLYKVRQPNMIMACWVTRVVWARQ